MAPGALLPGFAVDSGRSDGVARAEAVLVQELGDRGAVFGGEEGGFGDLVVPACEEGSDADFCSAAAPAVARRDEARKRLLGHASKLHLLEGFPRSRIVTKPLNRPTTDRRWRTTCRSP